MKDELLGKPVVINELLDETAASFNISYKPNLEPDLPENTLRIIRDENDKFHLFTNVAGNLCSLVFGIEEFERLGLKDARK